jgi:anti-sigma regulatory factor (Ser/Thr protein kinase)
MSPSSHLPPPPPLPPNSWDVSTAASAAAPGITPTADQERSVTLRLCLDLPSAPVYVTHLRRCVRCLLDSLCISREEAEDLELALAELAANAVMHSGGDSYHVDMEFVGTKVVMTVTDQGIGFPEDTSLPLPGPSRPLGRDVFENAAAEERIGGFGLPLVRSIADHVEIERAQPRGTTVRAYKALRGSIVAAVAAKNEERKVMR